MCDQGVSSRAKSIDTELNLVKEEYHRAFPFHVCVCVYKCPSITSSVV